jgi:hypothetical protein
LSAPNAANQLTKKPRIPKNALWGAGFFKKESKKYEAEKCFSGFSKREKAERERRNKQLPEFSHF